MVRRTLQRSSECQPCFPGSFSQSFHPPVKPESRAVECDAFYTGTYRALGNNPPDDRGRDTISAVRDLAANVLLHRRRARNSRRAVGRKHLSIDVPGRSMNAQPRNHQLTDVPSRSRRPKSSSRFAISDHVSRQPLLLLLRFLPDHILVAIPHTLALVRLRWAVRSDLGCRLPDPLLVRTSDDDLSLGGSLDGYISRTRILDGVRKSKRKIQHPSLHLRPVSDADKAQLPCESAADASDHIRYQRPRSAGLSHTTRYALPWPTHHRSILVDDIDRSVHMHPKTALRPLDRNRPVPDCDINVGRNTYGHLRYSRHLDFSGAMRRRRQSRHRGPPRGPGDRSSGPSTSRRSRPRARP